MIYDAFLYNGEIELLKLRLDEGKDVVDRFVIVECDVTHQGQPKKTTFGDQLNCIGKEYLTKIHYELIHPLGGTTGEREMNHRRSLVDALVRDGVKTGDVIHTSDMDEITSKETLANYRPEMGVCSIRHKLCYYWFNCVVGDWHGAKIGPWEILGRDVGGCLHRLRYSSQPGMPDGHGWHFSYLGGVEAIKRKLASFLHADINHHPYNQDDHLDACIHTGVDFLMRDGFTPFRFEPVDHTYPELIRQGYMSNWVKDACFHEDMYGAQQLVHLAWTARRCKDRPGSVVEIGCWEGRSTVALARACWPSTVYAVDTWKGNLAEHPNHPTVVMAKQRDVYKQFVKNIKALTDGNVVSVPMPSAAFLNNRDQPFIKFAHIDGSHDYKSVKQDIQGVKQLLLPGGIICGDDFQAASAARADLDGGVERAVRELCPGFEQFNNLWVWESGGAGQ